MSTKTAQDNVETKQASKDEAMAKMDAMMQRLANSLTPDSAPTAEQTGATAARQFKMGWSYDVYLRKNKLPPSEAAARDWREANKAANLEQAARMNKLVVGGFKTKCSRKAVWNQKAKGYDTALTMRVVEPDCCDAELIEEAYTKAQARQAKLLASMRAAAVEAGVKFDTE